MQYISHSDKETYLIAKKLCDQISSGVIALIGDLGAGKTTFTQGFAKALGIVDRIISPTFVLIRQHPTPNSKKILFHLDLYRLDKTTDIQNLGLEEIITNPENIVLIEWAEKAKKLLPKNTIWINFELIDQETRKITVLYPDESQ